MRTSRLWTIAIVAIIVAIVLDLFASRLLMNFPLSANVVASVLGALLIALIVDNLIAKRDALVRRELAARSRGATISAFEMRWRQLRRVILNRAPQSANSRTHAKFASALQTVREGWHLRLRRNPTEFDGSPGPPIGSPPPVPPGFTEAVHVIDEWIGTIGAAGADAQQRQSSQMISVLLTRMDPSSDLEQERLAMSLIDSLVKLQYSLDRYHNWHPGIDELLRRFDGQHYDFIPEAFNVERSVIQYLDALADLSYRFRQTVRAGDALLAYLKP